MNVTDLEPAERDPKAIFRTVLMLIGVMIVGGVVLWMKYEDHQEKQAEEIAKGRSARSDRLTSNLKTIGHDGKGHHLFELEGKVWIVAGIAPSYPEENEMVFKQMKRLYAHYKDEPNVHFVCLSVEDPKVTGHEQLAQLAEEMEIDGDRWWFLTAETEHILGYMKDHLQLGHVTEREGEEAQKLGKWDIPPKLRIVDQFRRVRGKQEEFDFDIAKSLEEDARKTIAENPELADSALAKVRLNQTEEWEKLMIKYIDYILHIETEEDKDPDYFTAVIVAACFVLFIVVLGARYRMKVKGQL